MVTLTEALQPIIIERLEKGPQTLTEVSTAIKRNYYTVRASIQLLMADGIVTSTGLGARNAHYMLTEQSANKNSMPTLLHQSTNHKMIAFLELRKSQNIGPSEIAIKNFPKHIARLLMCALRLNRNMAQGETIQRIHAAMKNDLASLQHSVKMYENVLNNPKNWTEYTLSRYTEDSSWNEEEVESAFNFYFPEET